MSDQPGPASPGPETAEVPDSPPPKYKLTTRSFIAGYILAMALCALNSFITVTFGVMEEGPTIAALVFFAVFTYSKTRITKSEMIMVATMGSAGGTLGFMSNVFVAKAMIATELQSGSPYTIFEMMAMTLATSLIGLIFVPLLRRILIILNDKLPQGERLPWVGATMIQECIDSLVDAADQMQPRYLWTVVSFGSLYVIFNDSGLGWFPELRMITAGHLFFPYGEFLVNDNVIKIMPAGLGFIGAAIAFSPFLVGGSYLMSMRHCVGFLVGALILIFCVSSYAKIGSRPDQFIWPGVMFLTTSGLTALALQWRMMCDTVVSLFKPNKQGNEDPIMSRRSTVIFTSIALTISIGCLYFQFRVTLQVIIALIVIGGLFLNIIATRAAAQTYFNPARVMGILMMGVSALMGCTSALVNIAGAGVIAGSGGQGGTLTNDIAVGHRYKFPVRWQFWPQVVTVLTCSVVAALMGYWIVGHHNMSLDKTDLAAPVAKIWAASALMMDPNSVLTLPAFAKTSMIIGGVIGVLYTILERKPENRRWLPGSTGLGLGLVLSVGYSFGFMLGGIVMFYVLGRVMKFSPTTLTTIAIACLIAEGMGGILQSFVCMAM